MTEYRIRTTGEVKTQGEIRKLHRNVSLPRVWSNEVLEFLGVDLVTPQEAPEASSNLKVVVRNGVEQNSNGDWVYAWVEKNKFNSTEEETAFLEEENRKVISGNKVKRDSLLFQTDFWTLSDTPEMTAEQTAYRQALRDITSHANWPDLDAADWPTKP